MSVPIKFAVVFTFVILQLCLLFHLCQAQIVINEVGARNASILADDEGEFTDWIELYNTGSQTVNLKCFSLSDDGDNLYQWAFPNVEIDPKSFLTVFASGKGRYLKMDHWETVVYADDLWQYKVPESPVPSDWVEPGFDDDSWKHGKGGFGYGDGDDETVLDKPVISIYLRKTFTISDTADIAAALFHMDYDDGFVAYLNGEEIARRNVGVEGIPPEYNDSTHTVHEAQMKSGNPPSKFFLDKARLNLLIPGTNVLAIQAYNESSSSSDLSAIPFFSMAMKSGTQTYGIPPEWFKSGGSALHSNFKLSGEGETIYLTDTAANLIDEFSYEQNQVDHSLGRKPDGGSDHFIFDAPTPGESNSSKAYQFYTAEPQFSIDGGFYTGNQEIELSYGFPSGNAIYYTLDGSPPDKTSNKYDKPIKIQETTVIRAIAYGTDILPSNIATNTYIIDEPSTLPVFSMSTKPDNLWDWETGIYVEGPDAETEKPHHGANYWQNWEIPVHLEFYSKDGRLEFEQDFGAKIHGGWSRAKDQKSFRFLAKGDYGKSTLEYPFFPDKPIKDFKRFLLRNSGTDNGRTHFRDALMSKAVQFKTHNYVMDSRPCLLFINGQYWGMYNIREKIGRFYCERNFGADPENVDILFRNGTVENGNNNHFKYTEDIIHGLDMKTKENFDKAAEVLDMENVVDYFATEIYYINHDWPQNNIKYWRDPVKRTKWQYLLYDTDFGLGLFHSPHNNELSRILTATKQIHSPLLVSLLENETFRNYFINRYADLINTVFQPKNLKALVQQFSDSIRAEMPKHFEKWGKDIYHWEDKIEDMEEFIELRPQHARNHVEQEFQLDGQVNVTLKAKPEGAGKIRINSIIPDSLPWEGVYFNGVPVEITALPNLGFEFVRWEAVKSLQSPDSSQVLKLNIEENDEFTAYFYGAPDTAKITISEINYHSPAVFDAGDWVELYNYGTVDVNIGGWELKDEKNFNGYIIPENTVLQKNKRLVICTDTMKFSLIHPYVDNVIGPCDFNFSNGGEKIRLFNKQKEQFLYVEYKDKAPWPKEADGKGKTLELKDPKKNLNDPENWFAGCEKGSPGAPYVVCEDSSKTAFKLTINEINYQSSPEKDAGDWIELYNYGSTEADISGWTLVNSQSSYMFPTNTMVDKGSYLVVASDTAKFKTQFPRVSNFIGHSGINLINRQDSLWLNDKTGRTFLSMVYDVIAPWPKEANGNGATLELSEPGAELSNGNSWFSGCAGGSPGGPFTEPCITSAEVTEPGSGSFQLFSYPNPFDHSTTISFRINTITHVKLEIFDMYGRVITVLRNEELFPGKHKAVFQSENLKAGIYYCRLSTPMNSETIIVQLI